MFGIAVSIALNHPALERVIDSYMSEHRGPVPWAELAEYVRETIGLEVWSVAFHVSQVVPQSPVVQYEACFLDTTGTLMTSFAELTDEHGAVSLEVLDKRVKHATHDSGALSLSWEKRNGAVVVNVEVASGIRPPGSMVLDDMSINDWVRSKEEDDNFFDRNSEWGDID